MTSRTGRMVLMMVSMKFLNRSTIYIYINMQYFTATHFNPHSNDDYNNNMKIHSCVIQ